MPKVLKIESSAEDEMKWRETPIVGTLFDRWILK